MALPDPVLSNHDIPSPAPARGLKLDDEKLPYHLIDDDAEAEMVAVLGFGAVKYDPGNWALVEGARDRYFSAVRRHLRASRAGEILDPEHGLLALASVACSAHFLLALELKARPDLVESLPARYRASLEVARALREKRLSAADAASFRDLEPSGPGPSWTWRVTARGGRRASVSGVAPSREEAKEAAEREAAALTAVGVPVKLHLQQSVRVAEKPRAARKSRTAKKTSGR